MNVNSSSVNATTHINTDRLTTKIMTRDEFTSKSEACWREKCRQSAMICPLSSLLDVQRDGHAFYIAARQVKHLPTPWIGDCPSDEQLEETETGAMFEMLIDGERWRRVPLDVTWEYAKDNSSYPCTELWRHHCHKHCEFQFLDNTIHIDYLQFVDTGPLSGFSEFQFFLNGKFYSRGGSYTYFATYRRAWPACLRNRTFALIAYGDFAGSVLPGLSAWLIESKT